MHTHIPPWVLIPGVIFILPFVLTLVLMWGLWALQYDIKISTRILIRGALLLAIVLVPLLIFFANIPSPLKDKVSTGFALGALVFYWLFVIRQWIRRSRKARCC
jgi:hypothetical protein